MSFLSFFCPSVFFPQSAVGAAALVSIMLSDTISAIAGTSDPSLETKVDIALKLAFMTGLIQIFLGMLKMGELASLVSHPVMSGFCSGKLSWSMNVCFFLSSSLTDDLCLTLYLSSAY